MGSPKPLDCLYSRAILAPISTPQLLKSQGNAKIQSRRLPKIFLRVETYLGLLVALFPMGVNINATMCHSLEFNLDTECNCAGFQGFDYTAVMTLVHKHSLPLGRWFNSCPKTTLYQAVNSSSREFEWKSYNSK